MSLLARFEEKFQPIPESGCWVWTGYLCNKGYGIFWFDGGAKKAHRIAYEIHRGEIPAGMVIDHICRERSCVNPDHLRVVTPRENTHAPGSQAPARQNADKVRCPKCDGEYSKNNRGQRICRQCLKKYFRARQEKKRSRVATPLRTDADDPILSPNAPIGGPVALGSFAAQLPAGGW